MLAQLKTVRYPAETALLVALALFLPLLEAPKGLAWLGYVAAWLANRARARDFGGPWDLWDTLIAAWIASGFLVAAFAGIQGEEWRSTVDIVRYGSILWLVKRARYSDREIRWVLGALVASLVIGLAIGFFRLWTGIGKSGTLQLKSVGHVNHTAIYIAILLGVCAAWLFARWQAWRWGTRAVALAVNALVLVSLMVTASRGAIGVGLVLLLVLAAAWWPRWRGALVWTMVAVALVVGSLIIGKAEVFVKHETNVAQENVLSNRATVWQSGAAALERYPWFGVGLGNYQFITAERIKAWHIEAGRAFDPAQYSNWGHGHSIYINTLVERGVLGFAALAAVALAWLAWLVRYRPGVGSEDLEWILWGGAFSAWFVTFGVGTVNTTLHDEHAILSVLLLGLWLSRTNRRAS